MGIKGSYERFRESRFNLWFQRILRFVQFVSPVISIGLFASRLVKIVQQDPTEGRGRLTASNGAVVGILAAAILYTLIAMLLGCFLERKPKLIRWSLMFLDLCFVGAFIAVAYLTRPNGGSSGPCHKQDGTGLGPASRVVPRKANCSLPWGTFITAIVSTILHFITALFHEAKDRYNDHRQNTKSQREMSESTMGGSYDHEK